MELKQNNSWFYVFVLVLSLSLTFVSVQWLDYVYLLPAQVSAFGFFPKTKVKLKTHTLPEIKRELFVKIDLASSPKPKKTIAKPLSLCLLGTIICLGPCKSFAVIKNGGKEILLSQGERIKGWTVVSIQPESIILERSGYQTELSLKKKSNSSQTFFSNQARRVSRKLLRRLVSNPMQILREVQIAPAWKQGKIEGIRILSLPKDSLWFKLGLRPGDVLFRVNGRKIGDPAHLEQLVTVLDASEIELSLRRKGKLKTLSYRIY